MGKNWFDLHLHSYFSDGRLSPEDLIRECKKAGIRVAALTDHESVKGIPWVIFEGRRLGVKVIPGIEFSVDLSGGEQHILGLFIDYKAAELADFIKCWEVTKRHQIVQMVDGLRNLGFKISFNDVLAQSCGALSRAHIAYAILDRSGNNAILRKYNLKTSSEVFQRFLKENSPIYVERKRPPATEAIQLIKLLGGRAVWAHPFWREKDAVSIREKAAFLKKVGLDGIEVGYSTDYQLQTETVALHQMAQDLSMMETAGSDFHSLEMPFLNKIGNFELLDLELNLPKEIS